MTKEGKELPLKKGDIIQPSGARLANMLGLDTQVPAKPTYITSGSSKRKKIGNYPIALNHSKFIPSAPLGVNAIRVINALYHLGKDNITNTRINQCKKILSQKDKSQIKKNLAQLPAWIIPSILKIIGN